LYIREWSASIKDRTFRGGRRIGVRDIELLEEEEE
jgi:hypothetical protein